MTKRGPGILRSASRHWLTVVAVTMLGGAAGLVVSQLTTPVFTASANVYVSSTFGSSGTDLAAGSAYTRLTMGSFGLLATSTTVLQPVIQRLGLAVTPDDLAQEISASNAPGSSVMQVSDTNRSPVVAAAVANAVAQDLAAQIGALSPKGVKGALTMTARTVQPAEAPTVPSAPKKSSSVAIGLAAGLIAGAGIASFRGFGARRIRSIRELAAATGAPILGSVERNPFGATPVMIAEPGGSAAQRYRSVAAGFLFLSREPIVAVVADAASRHSADVALDLALVLGEGRRVLLIDADLRRIAGAPLIGQSGAPGLAEILSAEAGLGDVVQPTDRGKLDVVTAGRSVVNPAALLAAATMAALLDDARDRYQIVLIATAGIGRASDALTIAGLTDGVVIVAQRNRSTARAMTDLQSRLDRAGSATIGVILAGVRSSRTPRSTPHRRTVQSAALPAVVE